MIACFRGGQNDLYLMEKQVYHSVDMLELSILLVTNFCVHCNTTWVDDRFWLNSHG